MGLVPVGDQQMINVRMKLTGHGKGQCDFCVSKDCSVIKKWDLEDWERERD